MATPGRLCATFLPALDALDEAHAIYRLDWMQERNNRLNPIVTEKSPMAITRSFFARIGVPKRIMSDAMRPSSYGGGGKKQEKSPVAVHSAK